MSTSAGAGIEQSDLRQRVPDALDDASFELARRAERVDHSADVVDRGQPLDLHLAGLDVDGHLGDLDAERVHAHAGRVRAAGALAEDLGAAEQAEHLRHRPGLAVGGLDLAGSQGQVLRLAFVPLGGDLEDLPFGVARGRADRRPHRRCGGRAGRGNGVRAAVGVAEDEVDVLQREAQLLRRDLRHRGAGAGADVLHRRDHGGAGLGVDP